MKNSNPLPGDRNALSINFSTYRILLLIFSFSILLAGISGCKKNDLENEYAEILPAVTFTKPFNNVSNFPVDSGMAVAFNVPMDNTTINCSTFIVKNDTSVVEGTIKQQDGITYFESATELLPNTVYNVTITTGAKDLKGHNMPNNYTWKFTTDKEAKYVMTKRSDKVTDFLRDGSRMMQIGNYVYSFGGWTGSPEESYNDVYRSNGDCTVWEKMPDAPWHGRHVYGCVKNDKTVYVVGGDNLQSQFDVWSTTDGENWIPLSSNILDNRIFYGCTSHNSYIYVMGGLWHSDVWRSTDGISWTEVAANVPFLNGENFAGSLASFNGKLWMVCGGGSGGGTGIPRKTIWSSTDGVEWKQEKNFAGEERYYTDVCVWDNKLWVIGGYNYNGNVKSIWYMKSDGSWTEFKTPDDFLGRHATAVAAYNNKIVITCGSYHNDCWVIEKEK
jgi:hypothetical protein